MSSILAALSVLGACVFMALVVMAAVEALDAYGRRR
jgi:hypothetical protein